MKKHIQHPIFSIIAEAANELNIDAYAIGGYVRDIILERPCKDIDVVAVGSGIELAQKVSELLPNKPKVQVFKTYGTAMLRYKDIEIEFVGARKESYSEEVLWEDKQYISFVFIYKNNRCRILHELLSRSFSSLYKM